MFGIFFVLQIAQAWCGHGEEEEKESCIAGVQQHDQWSMVIDHLPQSNPKLNVIFSKQISDLKKKKRWSYALRAWLCPHNSFHQWHSIKWTDTPASIRGHVEYSNFSFILDHSPIKHKHAVKAKRGLQHAEVVHDPTDHPPFICDIQLN